MTMERKIGEIFEYEGEWYQCMENIKGNLCIGCSFYKKGMVCCKCPIDCEGVIFKKLEKVGEPYPLYDHIVQRYAGVKFPAVLPEGLFTHYNTFTVDIEVKQDKQNKEDMETNEKTITVPDGWEFDHLDERGNIVLKEKKKELPKTWLECLHVINDIEYIQSADSQISEYKIFGEENEVIRSIDEDEDRNLLPRGLGKPMLALCQLLVCRNAWWKQLGWKPDWKSPEEKYCIYHSSDGVDWKNYTYDCRILAFPTMEVRDQFLYTFRDLIEEAKELL